MIGSSKAIADFWVKVARTSRKHDFGLPGMCGVKAGETTEEAMAFTHGKRTSTASVPAAQARLMPKSARPRIARAAPACPARTTKCVSQLVFVSSDVPSSNGVSS